MNYFRNFRRHALFWIPFILWAPFAIVMAAVGFRQTLSDWELSGFLDAGDYRKWIGLVFVVSLVGFPMNAAGLLIRSGYLMGLRERDRDEEK